MARYTRAELLHLRDSPIIVYHTPPLPEWIGKDAVAAMQTKTRPQERQAPNRAPRGADETTLQSTRTSKAERQDGFMMRGLKDRVERGTGDDVAFKRRSEREKKEEFGEGQEFMQRRNRKTTAEEDPHNSSNRRQQKYEVDDDETFQAGKFDGTDEPSWFAKSSDSTRNEDDPTGKTVDDFERWKQSMKKNDGSGDAGLPALPKDDMPVSMSSAAQESESSKDVRPPPGFAGTTPIPIKDDFTSASDASLINGLFAGTDSMDNKSGQSSMPAGFFANSSASHAIPQQSAGKSAGASKFSKFFGQTNAGPTPEARPRESSPSNGLTTSDPFAVLSAQKNMPKSDDAEGFERILAMLSSQSAPKSQAHQPPPPQQQRLDHSARFHEPPMSPDQNGNRFTHAPSGTKGPWLNHSSHQAQQDFSHSHSDRHSHRSPDRHSYHALHSPEGPGLPATRDRQSTMMNHHTQNQDFFTSLMSQSQTQSRQPQDSLPASFGGLSGDRRLSPPSGPMPRFAHHDHAMSRAQYDAETHYRSQQAPMPQQRPALPQGRDDHDFLNQLMAEQRISSPPFNQGPYAAYPQYAQNHSFPDRGGPPTGFTTGNGHRAGPAWNVQYEIDPRIPNGAHYRP